MSSLASPHGRVAQLAGVDPGRVVLALFAIRWLAGIAENFGAAGASEIAATGMLAVLAMLFVLQFRIARPAALLVFGLIAWIFAGALSAAANPEADAMQVIALLSLLALYALFANAIWAHLTGAAHFAALERLFIAFLAVGGGLAVLQVLTSSGFVDPGKPDVQRAFGSDVHPVSFGIQLVLAATGLIVLRIRSRAGFKFAHYCLLALAAVAIYLTYARTAWAMALIIPAFAGLSSGSIMRRLAIFCVLSLSCIAFAVFSGRFDDLASLPAFLAQLDRANIVFDHRYVDNSFSWRIVNWAYGLAQAAERPWLGHGPGQSALASAFQLEMHNIALEMFFELGAIGIAAFALVLAGLIRLHMPPKQPTRADRIAPKWASGMGLAMLAAVMISTSLVDQLMTVLLYLLVLRAAHAGIVMPAHPPPAARLPM